MTLPEFFPSLTVYVLCAVVMALAQLIYATVGFGAGIFSIALLAMLLPDLAGSVALLFLLTLATEVWVLSRVWRHGRLGLLIGLLPTTVVGLWLGTEILVAGEVEFLKRILGGVVLLSGLWFLYQRRDGGSSEPAPDGDSANSNSSRGRWLSLPVGLTAGVLGGLFGTAAPPILLYLKACRERGHRLKKDAFRSTLIWYFFLMGFFRAAGYVRRDVLTSTELHAALWLLPPALVGTWAGMRAHGSLSEQHFGALVSVLLVGLGALLLLGGGR